MWSCIGKHETNIFHFAFRNHILAYMIQSQYLYPKMMYLYMNRSLLHMVCTKLLSLRLTNIKTTSIWTFERNIALVVFKYISDTVRYPFLSILSTDLIMHLMSFVWMIKRYKNKYKYVSHKTEATMHTSIRKWYMHYNYNNR